MDVFTSIALNYLPKARVLASSLKRLHPDWIFHLCIADQMPDDPAVRSTLELPGHLFDTVTWVEDLAVDQVYGWIFKHTLVEICTAVKGPMVDQLLRQGAEKILYLDPDIAVFNSLTEIDALLDAHPIILTPHLLDFEESFEESEDAIRDNEVGTLKHGTFNLGFLALNHSDEGRRFAGWWNQRLLNFCYADIPNGLFTDQRWCDLVPSFFADLFIWRDPGCNVASWNLSRRELTFSPDGMLLVNGSPLKFYHFTGYDSGEGDVMTRKYAGDNHIVHEVWDWYRWQLDKHGQAAAADSAWRFGHYANGVPIPDAARILYRHRRDLQNAFPNPFQVGSDGGYWAWYRANG